MCYENVLISSPEIKKIYIYFICECFIHEKYTMRNKFSNCFVWMSPSTLDLEFHLLS